MTGGAPRFGLVQRCAVSCAAALLSAGAWAACLCGVGDARFTLTTISIDGDVSDWAPVHADLDNNVCDGPSGGLTDRDAPVQSTGRDLTHFALTWDQSQLYLFTARSGSSNNVQRFVYYADTDDDALMETGERVFGAEWKGNNREVSLYVFEYVSAAPGGDPMVDAQGFADGYTLPGTFANVSNTPVRAGQWGSSDGLQMEFAVTWAELGLPPGSGFTFHVASANASLGSGSFTAQIDDNLSGCGGGLGSTRQPGLTFTPDLALNSIAGATVAGLHIVSNTGNTADTYDLVSSSGGDHLPGISYYADTDASGTLTATDTLLTDTDGDGTVDTGTLASGANLAILIAYEVAGTATGTATLTTTAASSRAGIISDTVVDTVEVVPPPVIRIAKTVTAFSDPKNGTADPFAIPGAVMLYTIRVENRGSGPADAGSIVITDVVPAKGSLKVDDIGPVGSGPVAFADGAPSSNLSYTFGGLGDASDDLAFSNDGGVTFDYTPTADAAGCDAAVTHIRINPQGALNPDNGAGPPNAEFSFRFRID
jgi:uncharacterized repeat protein (TIGR01451 family)